jgi:DNA-binding response OmpR family regulator
MSRLAELQKDPLRPGAAADSVKGDPPATSVALRFDGLILDPAARTLTDRAGQQVKLRRSEFELLLAFVRHPGRALTRDVLLDAVAGRRSEPYDRSVDVLVGRLRRKLERDPKQPRLVVTVPGLGYRFDARPLPVASSEPDRWDLAEYYAARTRDWLRTR